MRRLTNMALAGALTLAAVSPTLAAPAASSLAVTSHSDGVSSSNIVRAGWQDRDWGGYGHDREWRDRDSHDRDWHDRDRHWGERRWTGGYYYARPTYYARTYRYAYSGCRYGYWRDSWGRLHCRRPRY